MEIIKFQEFMKGPSLAAITPDPQIFHMVDIGFNFFLTSGAVLLTLVLLEKAGFSVNETLMRVIMIGSIAVSILLFVFKHGLFRHIVMGW
ncbi:hypothetical protein SAMN05877753_10227 [Bacillus oleivorans]|uniref:Uncharacterized protein n=1 Tax=Bacillus oleivorans TaxID=1448271 RepID=A0A285CLC9_9BACI|nr:hypothetical protein [Bacillus oleivorans]SNX67823.1 hypothetical protein SAMN05877753_10227 [Bacillus oleivorans]